MYIIFHNIPKNLNFNSPFYRNMLPVSNIHSYDNVATKDAVIHSSICR